MHFESLYEIRSFSIDLSEIETLIPILSDASRTYLIAVMLLVATTCSKEIVPTIRFFKSPSSGSLVNSSLITGSTNDP